MRPKLTRPKPLLTGRLSVHRDGYGFVTPDHPFPDIDGDVFIPPDAATKAMHGDRVAIRVTRRAPGRDGRARVEGDITRILERANAAVVGTFRVKRRGFWVEPHDDRLRQWIHVPTKLALPKKAAEVDRIGASALEVKTPEDMDGMIVNVEIIEFPAADRDGVGRVIEILGHPDDFGVDVEIIIRKYRIPHRFPPDVLEQAQSVPLAVPTHEHTRRRDFRSYEIVTIDGETARDFDDAVWVDRLPNGNWALHVHIADVSHYVRPGSAIDREAAMRGTSVYFPDRAVPMLPLELSTEVCSLKPHVDRLVMSALLEIDNSGDVVGQEFVRGVIHSDQRMTYTDVNAILEGDAVLRERYGSLTPRFEMMRELALILNRKRVRRGSIDFDLPEPLLEFDEFGEMVGIARAARNIAHRIIEEFMLAANEAVAVHVTEALSPMVYRIHEKPDPKKVIEFEQVAAQFGVSLGVTGASAQKFRMTSRHRDGSKSGRDVLAPPPDLKITSRHYQKLIQQMEGKPEERILNYLMLRSLKQARYSAENDGHFALASDCYTHFTSPIRRYPDLLVHRLLGALLDAEAPPYAVGELDQLAQRNSTSERTAADAERELVEWKKMKFMVERVGDEFHGLIVSTSKYGLHVELADLFVEGFVPIDSIPGDRYGYEESTRRVVGARSRHAFRIGDPVEVRLDRISQDRRLEFSLLVQKRKP
ncbi:MAG: RNB domain-containing ribonuclease [Bryobacteraceae bacterium]